MQDRGAASDAGFDSQADRRRPASLHQLLAVFRHELLVRRHQVLASVQGRLSDGPRRPELAHELHHDVYFRVADHLLPIRSDFDRLAEPGQVPLVDAARTNIPELQLTPQASLHLALVLEQDLDGPGAYRPEADNSNADGPWGDTRVVREFWRFLAAHASLTSV